MWEAQSDQQEKILLYNVKTGDRCLVLLLGFTRRLDMDIEI